MPFIENDGGRAEAGHEKTRVRDCVARAIAIVTGRGYDNVCNDLIAAAQGERAHPRSHPANGVFTNRTWFKRYMVKSGFSWTATMGIGTGCKVHLREGEMPERGRFVVCLSQHYTAVVDGVVMDTYDPSREGTRCVYGHWKLTGGAR